MFPSSIKVDGVPLLSSSLKEDLTAWTNFRSAALLDFTEKRSMLVLTRFGDTAQLHAVGGPGMARRQLTFFEDSVAGARAGRDNWIVLWKVSASF